jgi:hypothetical protein
MEAFMELSALVWRGPPVGGIVAAVKELEP